MTMSWWNLCSGGHCKALTQSMLKLLELAEGSNINKLAKVDATESKLAEKLRSEATPPTKTSRIAGGFRSTLGQDS